MSCEVLYNYEKERIRRLEDAVVCCLHCFMTTSGYKCIGGGEEVASHSYVNVRIVQARDCNPGIPDVFLNPECRDWQSPNPGISGLKKNCIFQFKPANMFFL